jgi:hypothetical protein
MLAATPVASTAGAARPALPSRASRRQTRRLSVKAAAKGEEPEQVAPVPPTSAPSRSCPCTYLQALPFSHAHHVA